MKILGLSRCTAFRPALEKLVSNRTLGPDHGWELLSEDEIRDFCVNAGQKLQHRGRSGYDHVCAAHSAWAFDAHDSSYIRCVVFLHYHVPRKALGILGDVDHGSGAKMFNLAGEDLLLEYRRVQAEENEAHVWKRASHGEIAIDFCLREEGVDMRENREGRLELPDFIPG